jgi:hypothetical protein
VDACGTAGARRTRWTRAARWGQAGERGCGQGGAKSVTICGSCQGAIEEVEECDDGGSVDAGACAVSGGCMWVGGGSWETALARGSRRGMLEIDCARRGSRGGGHRGQAGVGKGAWGRSHAGCGRPPCALK